MAQYSLEIQLQGELNGFVKKLKKIRDDAILDTLFQLGAPVTAAGKVVGKGIGSPVWTGNYNLNHRIMINGEVEGPEMIEANELDPVDLDPEQLVAREKPKLARAKFTDDVSIVNDVEYADQIEEKGTPLIPEGQFYAKAFQYLEARLQRDLDGLATVKLGE